MFPNENTIGLMIDGSNNLEPGEIELVQEGDDWRIISNDGTILICPGSILPKNCTAAEKKLHACMQYLFRYKFAQFKPSALPTVLPPTQAYKSILHIRHDHSYMHLPPRDAALCHQEFKLSLGDRVLECGPFIGFSTVHMARCVGNGGKIVSCEMDATNIAFAARNVLLNKLSQVTLIHAATSEKDGTTTMYRGTHQANSIIPGVVAHQYSLEVPALSLHSMCAQHNFTPNFIILSINGAELSAIRGSKDFLASLDSARIIAVGMYKDAEGIIGLRMRAELESIGYRVFGEKTLYALK